MHVAAGFRSLVFTRLSRIALVMAMLAGAWQGDRCLAQNAPAAAPVASAATPTASATPAHSDSHAAAPAKTGAGVKPTAKKPGNKLAWPNLSAPQQQALAPLAVEWTKMSDLQKEKWLVISKKYAQMKPEEQQRLHDRMRDWVKLTPAQRSAARTNYARAKKLDTEEKNEQWNKYQQLPDEQKKKLEQAKLPKRVAKLPSTPAKAAPVIQLPAEALDRPLPPAPAPAPALAPGSQAAPQSVAPTALAVAAVASGMAVAARADEEK